jgi:hypothetical protein
MPRLAGMRSADIRRVSMPREAAATRIRITSPARTTPHGLRGRNSWPGWGRSFRSSARGVVATSGSEETAGRSRLTSNRRFASGRRPGWLRPREVSPSHTSANRSNHRPSLPPVARRSTGESSCRSMTTGQSFRRRTDELPVIDIHSLGPASDARRRSPGNGRLGRGLLETPEKRHRSGCGAFRKTRSGRPGRSSRGSRVAHQPEDRGGGAIDRAILPSSATCT